MGQSNSPGPGTIELLPPTPKPKGRWRGSRFEDLKGDSRFEDLKGESHVERTLIRAAVIFGKSTQPAKGGPAGRKPGA